MYAEEALCLALARRLGRPVKWIEERSEAYVATIHGRDVVQEIELAATAEGKITAVRARLTAAMGAYLQLVTPGIPLLGAWLYGGCYDIPAYSFECTGVFTHTTPTDAYRGAGRPEATYAIERAVDALAGELGMDPVELRRTNFITEFPATLASGLTVDSGDYDASLDRALERLDLDALRAEQAERRERGDAKQLGIGFSTYIEMCGLAPSADPRRDPLRRRRLGRGHDPLPAERHRAGAHRHLAPRAGPRDDVRRRSRPTELGYRSTRSRCCTATRRSRRSGMDTYGSRSLAVGGVALCTARRRRSSRRRGRSRRTSSRSPRTSSSTRAARFSVERHDRR